MREEKKSLRQQDNKVIKNQNNMDQESKNIRRLELQREDGYRRYDKRDDSKKVKPKQVEKEKSEIKEKDQEKDQVKDEQKYSAKAENNSVKDETTTTNNTEALPEDKEAIYIDKLKRLMAEFDNYRKRNEKEKLEIYDRASSNLLTEMLPIVDNFERALEVETTDKTLYEGISMIYKQLMSTLEKAHIKVIEAKGKPFDPNLHNAILHIEDEKYGENEVVEELQKGYLYKDKVLRYSMVKVAN